VTPSLLAALPVHSLIRLEFSLPAARQDVSGQAVAAALVQLSNLQQLRLSSFDTAGKFAGCLAVITYLSRLTSLSLEMVGSFAVAALGSQLQQLLDDAPPLRQLQLGRASRAAGRKWPDELHPEYLPVLDLSGLTQLEEFGTNQLLPQGFVLPAQLQRLQLGTCGEAVHLAAVTGLQQLRQLSMPMDCADLGVLLSLLQLPALQHLTLEYYESDAAVVDAPAWQQLPLQELYQDYESNSCYITGPKMAAILKGVAAATTLTRLQMEAWVAEEEEEAPAAAGAAAAEAAANQQPVEVIVVHDTSSEEEEEEEPGVVPSDNDEEEVVYRAHTAACASLAGLTQLKHLSFDTACPSVLMPDDVMALTALTNLTHLDLEGLDWAVGGPVATALAYSLKQLRYLSLSGCELGSRECLAAIGQLKQLTELRLDTAYLGDLLTQEQLMQLTGLSRLQKFKLYNTAQITDEVIANFRAALRRQQYQQLVLLQAGLCLLWCDVCAGASCTCRWVCCEQCILPTCAAICF
jgi:hypothetical protein